MVEISPQSLSLLHSLALGFAVAGLLVAVYRAATARSASFRLLQMGPPAALLAVPFLAFAAPAIIIRNTIRGRRIEGRPIGFVFLAGIVASTWSLMSGRVLTMALAPLMF